MPVAFRKEIFRSKLCLLSRSFGVAERDRVPPSLSVRSCLKLLYCEEFFEQNAPIAALGVGSFGPVQLNSSSAEFGYIYNSPKPGWTKVGVKGLLEERLKLAVTIDTDVNCAALGELYYGVAKHARNFVYLTLGTGIGGSLVREGKLVHGILSLEMGHMRIPHETLGTFKGACVFHGSCLEGIASGYAMSQRYGKKAEEITDEEIWGIEAGYIASALNNLMMIIGPELIVLGGGLMDHPDLMASIRTSVQRNINNYLDFPALENYIVGSSGSINGVLGAIKLTSLLN